MRSLPGTGFNVPFFKAVGAVISLRGLGGALLFATQILLAGWMGPDAFGRYSFAWATVSVLGTLAGLGFTSASVRFISAYRAADELPKLRGLLGFGRTLTLGVGGAFAVLAITAASFLPPESPYRSALQLAFLAIPIIAFMNLESAYARGFHWMALSSVAEQIARPTLLIAMGWIAVRSLNDTSTGLFVSICVFAYAVAALGQHCALRSRIRGSVAPGPREKDLRAWLRVSLPMLLLGASQVVRMNTDLVMLGLYLEPADVGIYTAALRTSTLVSLVFMVTGVVAQPTISSLYAQDRLAELQAFVRTAARWIFAATVVIGGLVLLIGPLLLGLFGEGFVDGHRALLVLTLGHVAVAVLGPSTALLAMTGHQDSAAIVHAFSMLGGIALNAALIPLYGILGAALATAGNLLLMHFALFLAARRDVRISPAIFGS